MTVEPGWCIVCGLPVPAGVRSCPRTGVDDLDVWWRSHKLGFMTELVERQAWTCPWCRDALPGSPEGTAIDHIIPRVHGGPHRRWNLQLLHGACNSAKGDTITDEALDLADAHGVPITCDVAQYRAGVRQRAARYARRIATPLGAEARARAMAAARNLTVFYPDAKVHAAIRAAAEGQE